MATKDEDVLMDKDTVKRLILDAKTPLEQINEIVRVVYKVGRKVLPEYLDEWGREGSFDFLSCLLGVGDDDYSQDLFFRAFDVERNFLDVCSRKSVEVIVEVSEKFYRIAGKNLLRGTALEKLESYLSRNPDDIDEAIEYYKNHYPLGVGLSFAWMAALKCNGRENWGKYLTWIDAARGVEELTIALHVLMLYPTGFDVSFVEDAIVERIVNCQGLCNDEGSKSELYRAAKNWRKIVSASHRARLDAVIMELEQEGCASVLYYAAQDLCCTVDQLSEADVESSFSLLQKVGLEQKGTLGDISLCLQKVIDKFPLLVFGFIEEYCVSHKCNISVFENLCQSLIKCDKSIRDRFFTKWLMADSIVLARNVHDVASYLYPENRLEIAADFGLLNQATEEDLILSFLRAIGWLYLTPEACVSFLVSCACLMAVDSLKSVHSDFFYLVVLNYLDVYKSELEKVPREGRRKASFKYLKKLAENADDWWKKLKKKGECPEIAPSMRQRELCSKHRSEIYGKAMREAREQSVLSFIARNIQLLHGRGWIVPTFTAEGEKLQESVLKRFSASVRMSRLSEIEGHTLETRLTELRRVRWEVRA